MSDPKDDDNRDDPALSALIEAVADGEDVDWERVRSSAGSKREQDSIDALRTVALLSKLVQVFGEAPAVPEPTRPGALHGAGAPGAPGDGPAAETWGSLQIRDKLGQGTFGTVYRAWEPELDRAVALKLFHGPRPAPATSVAEARHLARIRHPHVVSVYGADERDGRVGFWMELVTGRTLQQLLHDYGPLSAREALLVGVDLCHALAAVHQAGFLHCDLKAQNVMREAGGRIVLMDFGASVLRRLEGDEARRTRGTPLYLAPEVLRGEPATVQSDFYSLGVLLFYLVSGEFPFEGRSLSGLQAAHVQGQRKLLRDVRPDLPGPFVSVVDAATAARRRIGRRVRVRSRSCSSALPATRHRGTWPRRTDTRPVSGRSRCCRSWT